MQFLDNFPMFKVNQAWQTLLWKKLKQLIRAHSEGLPKRATVSETPNYVINKFSMMFTQEKFETAE